MHVDVENEGGSVAPTERAHDARYDLYDAIDERPVMRQEGVVWGDRALPRWSRPTLRPI